MQISIVFFIISSTNSGKIMLNTALKTPYINPAIKQIVTPIFKHSPKDTKPLFILLNSIFGVERYYSLIFCKK